MRGEVEIASRFSFTWQTGYSHEKKPGKHILSQISILFKALFGR